MATRIPVGNLPYTTDTAHLTQVFREFGEVVDARAVIDRGSGQSTGFGGIEMASEEAARQAMTGRSGTTLA